MEVFVKLLLEMSLTAAIVILAVIAVRWLFALLGVPKRYACLLWVLPFIRLVCPWSPQSDFSLLPDTSQIMETVASGWQEMTAGASSGADTKNQSGSPLISNGNMGILPGMVSFGNQNNALVIADVNQPLPSVEDGGDTKTMSNADPEKTGGTGAAAFDGDKSTASKKTGESAAAGREPAGDKQSMLWWTLFFVWLAGVLGIAAHSFISYGRLKKRLEVSWLYKDNIYLVDEIGTAFVAGYQKPVIYLPSGISKADIPYVITHEQTHIARKDYRLKPLAFFITALHWFNPLCWLAFVLLGKDMEMSCDEAVIEKLGPENRKPYANALLAMAAEKMQFVGMPLAFAEGDPKNRIKNVMKYKKPAVFVLVVAAAFVLVLAATLLTGPKDKEQNLVDVGGDTTELGVGDSYAIGWSDNSVSDDEISDGEVDEISISDLLKEIQTLEEQQTTLSNEIFHLQYDIDKLTENMENMSMPKDTYETVQADLEKKQSLQEDKGEELKAVELQLQRRKEKLAQIQAYHIDEMMERPVAGAADPDDIPFGEVNITAPVVMVGADGGWGADFVELVYASPDYAVGYGHMGLFVYSVKEKRLTGAVNVEAIGCDCTQGDDYTDVFVADEGATVYLHSDSKDYMFAYHIFENTLEKLAFTDGGNGRPQGLKIDDTRQDMRSVMGDKYADCWISSECVIYTLPEGNGKNQKYLCYLESASGALADLSYVTARWNEEEQAWSRELEPGAGTWEPYDSESYWFFEGDDSQYLWEYTEDSQMYFAKAAGISATGLTLGIYNNSDNKVMCDAIYKLYVYDRSGGNMSEVPYFDKIAYKDIAYIIEPHGVTTMSVDWSAVYGSLRTEAYPRTYRLVKEIYVPKAEASDGSGDSYEKVELGVEFTFPVKCTVGEY